MVDPSSDRESEQVQINFRASRKQKEKWKHYAEDAGFNSFSDFIRVAIEHEVRREGHEQDTAPQPSGPSTVRASELIEHTKTVSSTLEELRADVQIIKSEVREDDNLREFKEKVFSALPKEEDDFTRLEISVGGEMKSVGATVQGLSKALETTESRVQEALRLLMDETNRIKTTEIEGDTYYYKEV